MIQLSRRMIYGTATAGAATFIVGLWLWPQRVWGALLLANFFFLSLALAGAVFVAIQNVASAGWSVAFRRVPEAMMSYLPVGAALTLILLTLGKGIFPWAVAGEKLANAAYLNLWFMAFRSTLFFAVWIYLTRHLASLSRRQDNAQDLAALRASVACSAIFLVVFAFTFTLYSIDWLMALEPRWESTIYPWYVFAGLFKSGLAGMVLLIILLRQRGAYRELNEHHFHDLGKFLFAFSAFWAYLWFSQYLLIWYSNIPEETSHYAHRLFGSWQPLFWLNPIVNFVLPFAILLPASRKKREILLATTSVILLVGHGLDLYLLIMPPLLGPRPILGISGIFIFAAVAVAFLYTFKRSWSATKPAPAHDPYLEESLHFEGV